MCSYLKGYQAVLKTAGIAESIDDFMENLTGLGGKDVENAFIGGSGAGVAVGLGLHSPSSKLFESGLKADEAHAVDFDTLDNTIQRARGTSAGEGIPDVVRHSIGDYSALPLGAARSAGVEDAVLFTPNTKNINPGQTRQFAPSVVMHELGHINNSDHRSIQALQSVGYRGRGLASLVGGSLGSSVGLIDHEAAPYAAAAAGAAPMLPTLAEEARASIGAQNMMKELIDQGLSSPKHLASLRRTLIPAYGTYLAAAAAPAAAGAGTAIIAKQYRDS